MHLCDHQSLITITSFSDSRCFRLILSFPYPSPEISHFSSKPWSLLVAGGFSRPRSGYQDHHCFWHLIGQRQAMYVCMHAHMNVLPSVFLHLCIRKTMIPTDIPKPNQHQRADSTFLPLPSCNSLPRGRKSGYHWYMQLSASLDARNHWFLQHQGHPALSLGALLRHRAAPAQTPS